MRKRKCRGGYKKLLAGGVEDLIFIRVLEIFEKKGELEKDELEKIGSGVL